MATHPEPTRPTGRHASLFIFDDFLDYEASTVDPRATQAEFDSEAAVREATGLTPNQFRTAERATSRILVAAGLLLISYMALGIIAAAFGGRM